MSMRYTSRKHWAWPIVRGDTAAINRRPHSLNFRTTLPRAYLVGFRKVVHT